MNGSQGLLFYCAANQVSEIDIKCSDHDQNLARAFDSQAPKFEVAPVQSDPAALRETGRDRSLAEGCLVLDAGCGPGLVSAALLAGGYRVVGVDLSREMVDRAATALRGSRRAGTIHSDVGLSDGARFARSVRRRAVALRSSSRRRAIAVPGRQIELLRPGGVLVVNDHVTDPDPTVAAHHAALEIARDRTHTRNLTGGELVDLFASAGLSDIRYVEEAFTLDFDEWFDRGTPADTKAAVRDSLLDGPVVRSFRPQLCEYGSIRIDCFRAIVRGIKK